MLRARLPSDPRFELSNTSRASPRKFGRSNSTRRLFLLPLELFHTPPRLLLPRPLFHTPPRLLLPRANPTARIDEIRSFHPSDLRSSIVPWNTRQPPS